MMKICERCGKEFECLGSDDCWCGKLEIPEDLSKILKSEFKDCLCKDCLEAVIQKFTKDSNSNIQDKM
ncbi:MAG TPA: cysteine-rich CWC family protein [Bacteroidales bacterium]|nr:cysteine-rich CWC family protein [Bacteroidales bacterium]